MAYSQVGIINLALSHIGQKPISSIDEGSVMSVAALRVWESVLKDSLSDYNWGFANVIVALSALSNYTPLTEAYAYGFPSQALGIWKVYNEATLKKDIGEKFRVILGPANQQRVILTDIEDAYAEYPYYLTTVTLFPPKFVMALSYKLAAALVVPLNGKSEDISTLITLYNGVISQAKTNSEMENNQTKSEHNPIVDAR